jgi:DNA primase
VSELVVEILEDFLGDHRKHYEDKSQISFDCPVCSYDIKGLDKGDGKGNLEVNYHYNVYKCWACSETHDTHGSIRKLISKHGSKHHLKRYKLIAPEDFIDKRTEKEKVTLKGLPKEFIPLSEESDDSDYYKAITYLKKRNIGLDVIKQYNIGYASEGEYAGRVIFPSYGEDGEINYFLGRSYLPFTKLKYKNPEVSKMDIVFNEGKINWDSNIYLVEGVFDHIAIPNSVPMLGKVLNDILHKNLIDKASAKVIIVLDSDAKNDAINLYKKLHSSRLRDRVRIVYLPDGFDIADVYQKLGKKGVVKLLSTAKKLKEILL